MTLVKICGLTTSETVDVAIDAGADYLGFVLFPRSPRALTIEQARSLLERARGRALGVVLLVDPDDERLDDVSALRPDLIQLHGAETPERASEIENRLGVPVIKALPVATAADVDDAHAYAVSHVMFDASPRADADRPGGHGRPFDWSLLRQTGHGTGPTARPKREFGTVPGGPWFLAGGLTLDNVAEAIRVTGAPAVDLSSGVESAPGVKDPALIRAFIQAVRNAAP